MKKILLTMLVGFFATGAVMAQDAPRKAKKKSIELQLSAKKAEYDAQQKAKQEADAKRQTLPAPTPAAKPDLNKAAALTVENKN